MESPLKGINFRCPKCAKLYSVDASAIQTEKPQFECVQCKTRFWFSFPPATDLREIPTFSVVSAADALRQPETATKISQIGEAQLSTENMFACTKCGHKNTKGSSECTACGLVFEKARRIQFQGGPTKVIASVELAGMWERVIEDYPNKAKHETFIKLALGQNNLPFASQQYRLILDANPGDEIAAAMREKILNLATLTYVPLRSEAPVRKRMSMTIVVTAIGGFLFVSGVMLPQMRPMAPLGGMILALGFGIYFVNSRRV